MAILAFAISEAKAYDRDTHFYGTYAMARYAGIGREIATKMALSAQWMDEAYISDPASALLVPEAGIKKRRLLHFPSSRVVGQLSAKAQLSIFGFDQAETFRRQLMEKLLETVGYKGQLQNVSFFTETEEDHPLASEMIMEGLKTGNLMLASAGLHTLEDSFAHAGTPAEIGHAAFWHWPDRPFASAEKYRRMVRTVFPAIVAIRSLLPTSALDCGVRLHPSVSLFAGANCQAPADQLAREFLAQDEIQNAVFRDYLKDPRYVKQALATFFERARASNYVHLSAGQAEGLIAGLDIDGSQDAYAALEQAFSRLFEMGDPLRGPSVVDLPFILSDMGRLLPDAKVSLAEYVASYGAADGSGGLGRISRILARQLLKWEVPEPLGESHRMEIEDDAGSLRALEMKLRVEAMRGATGRMFGDDILFVENSTKGEQGFYQEVRMIQTSEDKRNLGTGVLATFSLAEKNAWDRMIFHYLFPHLPDSLLPVVVDQTIEMKAQLGALASYYRRLSAIRASDETWAVKKYREATLARDFFGTLRDSKAFLTQAAARLKPFANDFLDDVANAHATAAADNFFYRNEILLADYRTKGVVRPFLRKGTWYLF